MSSAAHPDRIWWSAAEIADARLPDMPGTKRGVAMVADRMAWASDPTRARRRAGRGGGWEYHWSLLPDRARSRLLREATASEGIAGSAPDAHALRAAYEGLTQNSKDAAVRKLRILRMVEAQIQCGLGKNVAVGQVARAEKVSQRTIWTWYERVAGVDPSDWLFALARRSGTNGPALAPIDPAFLDLVKSAWLRIGGPSFPAAFRHAARIAKAKGVPVPVEKTAHRRICAEVPRVTRVFLREGYTGLAKAYPPQIRDRSSMTAMEGVNADCHKLDIFVAWPGHDKPVRIQIVAFQDIYSGKILSWRIDHTPNKVMVMAALGDLIEKWGIPQHVLFDNGREFANKWLTGGAPTRFRFKIRDDDPAGVLELLGCQIHWAKPAHGQAKPIERAFRDLADDIARDPRFAGAYVGNRPDAKPENYGDRAIPLDRVIEVVEDGIAEHNARTGRESHTAKGRSFDETFAESYATAQIRKATDEQRRIWMMGQEVRKLHKTHGRLNILNNLYWSDWMNEHAGEKIIARFDPEDLHSGAYIYALDGRFMGVAECEQAVGFFDMTEARQSARQLAAVRKAQRALAKATIALTPEQLGQELDDLRRPTEAPAEARVVRAQFGDAAAPRGARVERPAAPRSTASAEDAARHEVFVAEFGQRKTASKGPAEDTARARYRRALDVQARSERGEPLGDEEVNWLRSYGATAEYRQMARMVEHFGEQALG